MNIHTRKLSLLAFLSSAAVASPVQAQTPTAPPPAAAAPAAAPPAASPAPASTAFEVKPKIDAPELSGFTAWAMLNWNGFGVGARYMFPLGIPSLLSKTKLRDSWALEAGLDYFRVNYGYGIVDYHYDEILPTAGVMWLVWLREDFAVYPKAEAGYGIGFNNSCSSYSYCNSSSIYIEGAAGLLYKLSGITLRAEVGSYGLKGGVAWLF